VPFLYFHLAEATLMRLPSSPAKEKRSSQELHRP
jgi:hypothetical protein